MNSTHDGEDDDGIPTGDAAVWLIIAVFAVALGLVFGLIFKSFLVWLVVVLVVALAGGYFIFWRRK